MEETQVCESLASAQLQDTSEAPSGTPVNGDQRCPHDSEASSARETNKTNDAKPVVYDKFVPAELKKKIAQTKKLKNGDKDCGKEEKKLVEVLIHVFDGLETTEQKLDALARKYVLLATDHRSLEMKVDEVTNKYNGTLKSKEFLQLENAKMASAKTKLECLCRELQKQNKAIKNDSNRRASEEDQKRKELSEKFQVTINEISTQVTENHQANQQLRQDNNELTQKLKGLLDQYELREQHIEKVLKAKELELQLCETKLQQQVLQSRQDKETGMLEKQTLLKDLMEQKKHCELLMKQEIELKGQLEVYTGKFEEFQSTLTKSNSVFATFQKEMGKMTKTNKKLEKDSAVWKSKFENTNRSVLQMLEERVNKEQELSSVRNKVEKLENLCRILQGERNDLRKQIAAQNPKVEHDEPLPGESEESVASEPTGASESTQGDNTATTDAAASESAATEGDAPPSE